jgi:hypothetical protein
MSRTLSIIGIALTVAYLGVLWFVFNGRLTEILLMAPNEIGDLLAGVFGPLAILWLILGFFQQGIELRQNTKALELQAEELRKSVEHQREMVEVSREQLRTDLEADRQHREERTKAALPRFKFSSSGMTSGAGYPGTVYTSTLQNVGSTVTDVKISCSQDIGNIAPHDFGSFSANAFHQIQWQSHGKDPALESWILISYIDTLGNHGVQKFRPIAGENGLFSGAIVSIE